MAKQGQYEPGVMGYHEWLAQQPTERAYTGQRLGGGSLGIPRPLDPGMAPNVERTLPPLGVELRDLNEALGIQAQLLAELAARLAPICSPVSQGIEANGPTEPPRSSVTEAVHEQCRRVRGHNEGIRNLLSGLEV